MAVKRMNIELPIDQYEFLKEEARAGGTTVSGMIRKLIEGRRKAHRAEARRSYRDDPFLNRRGSFDGPPDLASRHDNYLYQRDKK